MTIDKAIEILTSLVNEKPDTISSNELLATKLGIEALKRVKDDRYYEIASQKPLPGETKE